MCQIRALRSGRLSVLYHYMELQNGREDLCRNHTVYHHCCVAVGSSILAQRMRDQRVLLGIKIIAFGRYLMHAERTGKCQTLVILLLMSAFDVYHSSVQSALLEDYVYSLTMCCYRPWLYTYIYSWPL